MQGINPMIGQLNQRKLEQMLANNPMLNQIKGMMNTVRAAQNPQFAMNQIIQSNPKLQEVMNYINQNGGNPETAFYNYANQCGINPDEMLKIMRGL